MGQTVNLLAFAFGGSNPSLPTNVLKKRMQTSLDGISIFLKNCLRLFANSLCKRIAEVAQLIEH